MAEARSRAAAVAALRPGDAFASPLAWLRPIDSEHSAIWQCLVGEPLSRIASLVLTASGGPFLDRPADLSTVTPDQALKHPTWSMGAKITIDSATLANKGLEVIEARWLYDVDDDAIEVVVHPQSVVHSAVRFVDGSLKAQLGTPDMRTPIQYALTYPDRLPSPAAAVDLVAAGRLEFRAPDEGRFPALRIAREAGAKGLQELPGVGKAISAKIVELLERGTFEAYEKLIAETPESVLDLLDVSGIGLKTAATLYQQFKISSLEDLSKFVAGGGLSMVDGVGEKSAERIAESLRRMGYLR
jgi:1-deoxy-D-xylulose-5-phosphate reductoisomerase